MRSSFPHLWLAAVLLAGIFMLQGCAVFLPETTAKVRATPHAKPVVAALENYRKTFSEYPQALTNLYPKYLGTNVPLTGNDWRIFYQRQNTTNYQLIWYGGLSRAVYESGKPVQYDSPGVGH